MKRQICRFILISSMFSFVLYSGAALHAAIPASERAALIVLYQATGGDNWLDNSGWKDGALEPDGFGPVGSEENWFGIILKYGAVDHVKEIWLDNNQLSGSIPAELAYLTQLKKLSLHRNQLTGAVPPELGNLGQLTHIYFSRNQLSGSIPSELGNASKLFHLSIAFNQLSGSIPSELANIPGLVGLWLNNNGLTGPIPPGLGNLANLTNLELQGNQLTGPIPPELGLPGGLYTLNLGQNQLSGPIPPELGNLKGLLYLTLASNRLSGDIPSSITNMKFLYHIVINYNALYATDPAVQKFIKPKAPYWQGSQTVAPADITAQATSDTSARLSWTPIPYTGNGGGYHVYYRSNTGGADWTHAGMTSGKSKSYWDFTGLYPGTRYYFKIRTQTDAHNKNQSILFSEYSEEVSLDMPSGMPEESPPFGAFDTPIHGITAAGSIPVTGWALDDAGIENLKIYRELAGQLVYIGNAVFVEGARPDVAAVYPGYPASSRAGWGYMLLTNFLPNSGNGTYVLHAIATDLNGNTADLGTKTIHCDNDNAVKPFGAIDTPLQGGSASGEGYINFGWALTPMPNTIPIDGSTIDVWVDGVNLGHPVYNNYRSDIAGLFPGYANSEGAIGYFYLDATAYANGVHTIQWTVKDDAGNFDGIGSRYFTIQNPRNDTAQTQALPVPTIDDWTPVNIRKGYDPLIEPQTIQPDENGDIIFAIKPLQRLEIRFPSQFEVTRRGPVPIGSTLTGGHIFTWQTGPGFLGLHKLIFHLTGPNGRSARKEIFIHITPHINNLNQAPPLKKLLPSW
jgi:hypothetical protein